jgi:hypothetical protein
MFRPEDVERCRLKVSVFQFRSYMWLKGFSTRELVPGLPGVFHNTPRASQTSKGSP